MYAKCVSAASWHCHLFGPKTFSDSKPGSWILGGGWNNDQWGGDLPAASWIDNVTLDNPVSHNILIFLKIFFFFKGEILGAWIRIVISFLVSKNVLI